MTRPFMFLALLSLGMVTALQAEPPSEWKPYESPALGVRLTVKREWTEIVLKETKDTGSVTFQISSNPHASVSVIRQDANYSFDVWMSSTVLLQLFEPGYKKSAPVIFAGREAVKVIGKSTEKEGRREETYFFNRPPFIDQITFSAPADQWTQAEKDFVPLRQSLHWTR